MQKKNKKEKEKLQNEKEKIAKKKNCKKNFNFAFTPKFIPKLDIISGVEAGLRAVRDEAAIHVARSKVFVVLKSAKPPKETSRKRKKRP